VETRTIRKVTFVEFELATPHFLSATIMPRSYGLVLVASILKERGFDVRVYCDHIAPVDLRRVRESDLVCVSPLGASANKSFAFADHVRRAWGIPVVAGGTFATYLPDLCLEHFDYVIRNEGDEAVLELLACLDAGGDLGAIPGLSFRTPGGAFRHNLARPGPWRFDAAQDLSLIEGYDTRSPWWHVLTERKLRWVVLQASRGCPFHCDYCIAPVMYGRGYRTRTVDAVMADLEDKLRYGRYFLFMDNCFAGNRRETKELLRRIIDREIGATFIAFVRHEIASDAELLDLLRRAGFTQLYIGAESLNDEVFTRMNKRQTVERLVRSIETIRRHDIDVTLSFQAGNDEDDAGALERAVDFGLEHDLSGVYFISTWSWPDSPSAVFDRRRMILKSLDYTSGHFVTHFPLRMRPSTLQRAILAAQRRFWSLARLPSLLARGRLDRALGLAVQRHALSLFEEPVARYVEYLSEIEEGYYDAAERLDLAKIAARDLRWDGEYDTLYRGRLIGNFTGLEVADAPSLPRSAEAGPDPAQRITS